MRPTLLHEIIIYAFGRERAGTRNETVRKHAVVSRPVVFARASCGFAGARQDLWDVSLLNVFGYPRRGSCVLNCVQNRQISGISTGRNEFRNLKDNRVRAKRCQVVLLSNLFSNVCEFLLDNYRQLPNEKFQLSMHENQREIMYDRINYLSFEGNKVPL